MFEGPNINVDDTEKILRMLEVAYIEDNGLKVTDEKRDSIFPNDWDIDKNNEEKINILTAAIEKQEQIIETDEYQKYKGIV